MSFEVFVDESGSTGPNLNEAAQPLFVHAALLVPITSRSALRALAEQIRSEFLPRSVELHAGVLNTPSGRKRVADLLRDLFRMQILPVISLMERRIVRATYIVDTCFDYWWNDKAESRFMRSAEARQELSQTLVDLVSEAAIVEFAAALRRRDPVAIIAANGRIAGELRAAARADLSDGVQAAGRQLSEQCESIKTVDGIATATDTINAASFALICTMSERVALAMGFSGGKVIHDQCPQLPAYEWMFNVMRNRADGEIRFDNGQVDVPLRRILTLEAGDSRTEPLLQLADVVAGLYRRLTANRDRLSDPAFDDWLLYAMFHANKTCNVMVSRQLIESVWGEPLARFEARAARA